MRVLEPPELVLLEQWARGDRAAGERLLGLLLPGIYALALRMLGREADAEDVAQETFARLCAQVRKGTPVRDVRKWVATVAMNLCIDAKRRQGRQFAVEHVDGEYHEPMDTVEPEALRRYIGELPERYQAVLHYRFVLNMKPADIAKALDLEDGAARVLLHRALAALRRKVRS